jgi:hypothetical protein
VPIQHQVADEEERYMMLYGNPEHFSEGLRGEFRYRDPILIGEGPVKFRLEFQDLVKDQGLSIQALGKVEGSEVSLLRFYCLDHLPHYYYGPEERGDRLSIDQTVEGDSLEWSLMVLTNRLPELIMRAGFQQLADDIDMVELGPTLAEMARTARKISREQRTTVVHNRGDVIVEAGPIRFGIENREPGIAIHVLGDLDGEEKELLTFDCFDQDPHYHYGPRAKNQRLYLDTAAMADSLRWAIDLFKGGKLAPMLDRAGYHDHAARLNPATVAERVAEVEKVAFEMRASRGKSR